MIKNEKQLQVTKNKLTEFKDAVESLRKQEDVDPVLKRIQLDALNSQIAEFEKEIEDYTQLKNGCINTIYIKSYQNIAEALIKGRLAKGWTQSELAKKLNLKEQQIQRYEMGNYASASYTRINEIMEVLELEMGSVKIELKHPEFNIPEDIDISVAHSRLKEKGALI